MTPDQESHLDRVLAAAHLLISNKYRKGQAEHGGNLFDMPVLKLVNDSIEEAIDQLVYLLTIREKLIDATKE